MSLDAFNKRQSPRFAFLVEQAARALNWQPVNRTMADACERDVRDFRTAASKIGVALTALGRGRKGAAGKAIRDALATLNNSGSPVGVWYRNSALYSLSGAPGARHKSQREADAWLATMSASLARFVTVTLQEVGPQRFETPCDKLRAVRDFLKSGEALMRFHLTRARTEGNRRDANGKGRQALEFNIKDALYYLAVAYREGTGREPGISPHAVGRDTFAGMVATFCDSVGLDTSQALRLADEHRAYVLTPAPQWEPVPPTEGPWAEFSTPGYRLKL